MNPLTYEEAHGKLAMVTTQLRGLERDYGRAQSEAAAAEANYRRDLAGRYGFHRSQGAAQDEAGVLARADVAHLSFTRDERKGEIAKLAEMLEDRRGERASLHRLVDWSAARDAAARMAESRQGVSA